MLLATTVLVTLSCGSDGPTPPTANRGTSVMLRRGVGVAVLLLSCAASGALGQQRSQWPTAYRVENSGLMGHGTELQDSTASEPHVIRPTLGGLGGGIVGVVAGPLFLTGALCEEVNYDGSCAVGALITVPLGIAIGEPVGLFCGVHWANGRRGSQPLGLFVSLTTFLAGAAWIIHEDANGGVPTALWVGVPVTQLGATVLAERASGRGRPPRESSWC